MEIDFMVNNELQLAWDFVNNTDRNAFLTGKAGTGKTTFLHKLKSESLKRLVVVAPTGVAAINAKGVTIHSFFQMPFGPILPNSRTNEHTNFANKFSTTKIDIIKSMDLLVIDEISMVRADLLDGIDNVLRRYKNRNKAFGGVQLLMIGDLQQLSPVIKDDEWQLLRAYYKNGYFFSSKAFQMSEAITIELKHIYRQDNQEFIQILNQIRNNNLHQASAELLNKRFIPDFNPDPQERYITLTTHNNKADRINTLEVEKLEGKDFIFKASIEGMFPEYSYPTYETLKLKVGAQVMFIKNDSSPEKRYYNGKIGKIIQLSEDEVIVRCPSDDFDIVTTNELWENINYTIHPETKAISEKIIGSFSQMPLRLAWAITIHKSQGLTFEKAIIDINDSFAHGQTYVALSRCKSLEGLVLKNPIKSSSIINDENVLLFNKQSEQNPPDHHILNISQQKFQLNLIVELFDYYEFLYPFNRIFDIYYKNKSSIEGNIENKLKAVKEVRIPEVLKVANTFKLKLEQLVKNNNSLPEYDSVIQERFTKAVEYFENYTKLHLKQPLGEVTFSSENREIQKDISKHLQTIDNLLDIKLYCLKRLSEGFKTNTYLEARAKAILDKHGQPKTKKEIKIDTSAHPELFIKLKQLRSDIAMDEDIKHFQVFTQKTLYELCNLLPTTSNELKKIHGIGKIKFQKYGKAILEVIDDYCKANRIDQLKSASIEYIIEKVSKKNTKKVSLDLFKSGKSISDIAQERFLTVGTIETHLASFLESGEIDLYDLISREKFTELENLIKSTPFESLTELKNKLGDKFSYGELRIAISAIAK
ncbi:helix-turn-helix domain-containing protein [Subsaxibacter sp. CAU 1640]|uniref:helix-turn-helix domain-containing protein n=1 Tax=Subsaxibacter sp. CAU 1640 TaxID=2933271 RepID=UPI002006356C|nr:helix-turn-helix domain-containing protein [Subsaxibacter sp. CAU 1640]MCK7591836.1 helix-turn-helix domain-containing protein [Subsaxibacter sp. CAU 1640]